MSISPTALSTAAPLPSPWRDSLSGVVTGDPHVHGDGGAGGAGVDADVVHHRPHQRDALAAVRGRLRPGRQPAAAVGDGQPQQVRGDDGPQPDLLAGVVAVPVLDRVGDRFPRGDQGVLRQRDAEPAAVQPAPQPGADRPELPVSAGKASSSGAGCRYSTAATSSPYPPGGARPAMSRLARSSRESSLPLTTAAPASAIPSVRERPRRSTSPSVYSSSVDRGGST